MLHIRNHDPDTLGPHAGADAIDHRVRAEPARVRTIRQRVPVAVLTLMLAGGVSASDEDAVEDEPADPAYSHGLIELKRQSTARGTPGETTKTNLKFDWFLQHNVVSLLRLELPFPDRKATFSGSPFDPDFGDAKFRVGFSAFEVSGRPITSFVELTFPTADPESQSAGVYQLSAGLRTAFRLSPGPVSLGSPAQAFSIQAQQVVSFAGDPARIDINQTKFELEWRDTWLSGRYAKATLKPVIDWVGADRTGAVLELEGGWPLNPQWLMAFMIGGQLWGNGVPSTYGSRLEFKVVYRY